MQYRHQVKARKSAPCAAALLLSLGMSGCGGGGHQASSICRPSARHLVARTLGLSSGQVSAVRSKGNNEMPQCTFRAALPGGRHFSVTVNVDTSPQPYMVLARTIVERQQVFSPRRLVPAPIAVLGLGLLASWFPDESALMSTDGVRLVTTTVSWRGAKRGTKVRLATRISRLYLGRSKPSQAKLYP